MKEIYVYSKNKDKTYSSVNGGITWINDNPLIFMTLKNNQLDIDAEEINYTIHNNTNYVFTGNSKRYALMILEDDQWVDVVMDDEFIDEGFQSQPDSKFMNNVYLNRVKLNAGKYKIKIEVSKKLKNDALENFILECVFYLK